MLALGVLFYSSTYGWFEGRPRRRAAVNGAVFGALAVTLMIARIHVSGSVYVDARSMPLALVALFEGWPAGLIAGAMALAYRLWLGGSGVPGGALGIAGVVLAGALGHAWARRDRRATGRHAVAVGLGAFVASALGFAVVGERGLALLGRTWPHFFVADVVGITVLARLFQDVIERERLAAAQRRFRTIVDAASDAIRIVDAATSRIVDANRMDAVLSGCAREALIGRDSREFWPSPLAAADGAGASPVRAFGVPFRGRDGALRIVDTTRRTVEYDGRRYEIITFQDAADRQAAEAARREVAELRAVTMLASAAAHEINNPLTVIVGFLQLQRNRTPDAEDARWMDRVLGAAERIREIIVRMNGITRVETARQHGGLPAMLDLEKCSEPADAARRPRPVSRTEDA